MSNFCQGSAPKDAHQRFGKQDEEFRERHSLQVHSSSNNNQDKDFSDGHSPLMSMSSENKIQQQQQPQLINGASFQQECPLEDSNSKESSQISSHSQQQTLVTSPQGYPPKDGSHLNHQSSYPDLQQQKSSTKISTSQEQPSKGDYLRNTQNPYHLQQQQLLAGATSLQEQLPKEDSSNIRHLLPSGRVHSPPKDNYPQPCNQSSDPSKQQQYPISAHSPPKNNHPRGSNQSSHQSHQQPSPVTAPSERHLSEDDYTTSSRNPKHLQQQQPSDCLQGEPPKQAHPLKHSTIPMREHSNTTCMQHDSTNDYDPHKSQSPSIKDSSAQGHAASLKSEEHESVYHEAVIEQKDETLTEKVGTSVVESSPKNIRVPRTQPESSSSCCPCSIL